jgi:hypothetical protein
MFKILCKLNLKFDIVYDYVIEYFHLKLNKKSLELTKNTDSIFEDEIKSMTDCLNIIYRLTYTSNNININKFLLKEILEILFQITIKGSILFHRIYCVKILSNMTYGNFVQINVIFI